VNKTIKNRNVQEGRKGREKRWYHHQICGRKFENIVVQKVCSQKEQG